MDSLSESVKRGLPHYDGLSTAQAALFMSSTTLGIARENDASMAFDEWPEDAQVRQTAEALRVRP